VYNTLILIVSFLQQTVAVAQQSYKYNLI